MLLTAQRDGIATAIEKVPMKSRQQCEEVGSTLKIVRPHSPTAAITSFEHRRKNIKRKISGVIDFLIMD